MAEKDTVLKEVFKHKGIGDIIEFYNFMYRWLGAEDFSITEKQYNEKINGDVKDLEIKWESKKELTDYFRAEIEMVTKVRGMKTIEIEVDGKRLKTNEFQELEITFKAVLVKDYSSKWEHSGLQKFFKELYQKYIIPSRTEAMEIKTMKYVQDLKNDIKKFFDLEARK